MGIKFYKKNFPKSILNSIKITPSFRNKKVHEHGFFTAIIIKKDKPELRKKFRLQKIDAGNVLQFWRRCGLRLVCSGCGKRRMKEKAPPPRHS